MNLLERTRWIILRDRTDILCGTTRGLVFKPLADTGCTPVKTYCSPKKAIHSLEAFFHVSYDNNVYQVVEVSEILVEHLPQHKIQLRRQKITRFQDIPQFTKKGSYNVDYPLNSLIKWIEEEFEDGLILNPDFQRGHVWTPKQQKAFVEFLLRGGTTGRNLYFNSPSWHEPVPDGAYNDFVCVDGLQRITAISQFIHGKLKVFDSYYHEFTDKLSVTTNTMRVNINTLKNKKDVLQWYLDLNAGGTPHTEEEIERVKAMLGDLS